LPKHDELVSWSSRIPMWLPRTGTFGNSRGSPTA
jgi:hypothetical protein